MYMYIYMYIYTYILPAAEVILSNASAEKSFSAFIRRNAAATVSPAYVIIGRHRSAY